MDFKEARQKASMLKDLLSSSGWLWFEDALKRSLDAWENVLDTTTPVGEGAAQLARAQGAKIALKQCLTLPRNSMLAFENYVATGGTEALSQMPGSGGPPEES